MFDEIHIGKGEALCCALEKGITECRKFECEMFCWKLNLLFIISSIIMTYIQSFPTISNQFRTRQTDWRDRREQTTPVLNKILDNLEKKENQLVPTLSYEMSRLWNGSERTTCDSSERNHGPTTRE